MEYGKTTLVLRNIRHHCMNSYLVYLIAHCNIDLKPSSMFFTDQTMDKNVGYQNCQSPEPAENTTPGNDRNQNEVCSKSRFFDNCLKPPMGGHQIPPCQIHKIFNSDV